MAGALAMSNRTVPRRARPVPVAWRRAALSIAAALVAGELIARSPALFGFSVPILGVLPAPSGVLHKWALVVAEPAYLESWYLSFTRVLAGFAAALALGVPLGLLFATKRFFRNIFFPVFEVLRPVPPIAWVPAAIIFWPTEELSVVFVIFLGAFFTITLNTFNGARQIDPALIQSARSMGTSNWRVLRRIILPATLPSIVVGATIGMGITWEVVVAAEMISGGSGGAGGGLGRFMWNAYLASDHELIVVGMISIGLAGYLSSSALRLVGRRLTPWLSRK